MAARGELDFSSPEYQTIRRSIEQLIRFAHELTFAQFIVFAWHLKRSGDPSQESNLKASINSIEDGSVREKVSALVNNAHMAMVFMMFAKSPIAATAWLVSVVARR